jgi:hypothetical protein
MSRDQEEQRRYEADVFYEVWRSGGNPDRINDDCVSDSFYDGRNADDAARRELNAMRPKPEEPEQCEEEEQP